MTYFVIDQSGNAYGPADMTLLRQWVNEGRVMPASTLRDAATGMTLPATSIPGLFPSVYGAPPATNPSVGSAYYPRPQVGQGGLGSSDVTVAWVLFGICLGMDFICCSLVGLPFGIVGAILARRAVTNGNPTGQAALIANYVAIGISVVFVLLGVLGRLGGAF